MNGLADVDEFKIRTQVCMWLNFPPPESGSQDVSHAFIPTGVTFFAKFILLFFLKANFV